MNTAKADASETVRDSADSELSISPRSFFLLLLIYFALQTVVRTLISGTVDLDESEQLILTQKFAFGYGSQPPLYTWLQMLFFKTFGVSVFALALLKNLILLGIYIFTYLNVRLITRRHVCGMLGAVSLLFLPQVAWESQRDLTHSVLASAMVAATLFVVLRLRENSWRDYALFGFCAGLGLLSKYNYAAFLFGLVLSALTIPRFRPLILNRRIALSFAVCVAVLWPHLLWALHNRELLTTTTYKFHQQQENTFVSVVFTGLGHLITAVVSHIAPMLLIFAVIFRKKIFSKSAFKQKNEIALLILRKYGFILAGLILAIFVLRITGFKDRWFEPIFISLPLLLFAVAQNWIERRRAKQIFVAGGIIALAVLILIPSRILFAEQIHFAQLLNAPFARMKNELNDKLPPDALILAESKWLGGNLRMQFPGHNVVTPELAKLFPATNRSCVVIWDATKDKSPKPSFVRFLGSFAGIDFAEANADFVTANYQYYDAKRFRLGIATSGRGEK
jgi:4-amino-4-deoxy-L-arabinose transferase-like glycosyltransferase